MRRITFGDTLQDARQFALRAPKGISIDNCKLVDPCNIHNACEHGSKCAIVEDKVVCDCTGTGYIGKTCHFCKFIILFSAIQQ